VCNSEGGWETSHSVKGKKKKESPFEIIILFTLVHRILGLFKREEGSNWRVYTKYREQTTAKTPLLGASSEKKMP